MILRAAVAGVAGLVLGRASTTRGIHNLAMTALAVAAVPVGSALLQRLLGGDVPHSSSSSSSSAAGAASRSPAVREHRRRQLRHAAQQAAEEAAAAGAISDEDREMLRLVMQPSQSRTERVRAIASVLEWLRRIEADPAPRSRSTQLVSALVVHELNALVDEMDYEELYAAFGGHPPPKGLEDAAIAALPATPVTAEALPALHSSTCAICLDAFQEGETARELPGCQHAFHAACVDTWLRSKPLCPICRAQIQPASLTKQHPEHPGRAQGEEVAAVQT